MDKFREFIIAGTYMSVTLQDKNLQKFFVACSKIENTLITGDHVHAIEIAAVEQLKAEIKQLKEYNDNCISRTLHDARVGQLDSEIAALKSKLEVAKKGLEFYSDNGNEVGIWDNERNTNDWGFRAKETLKEICKV